MENLIKELERVNKEMEKKMNEMIIEKYRNFKSLQRYHYIKSVNEDILHLIMYIKAHYDELR